MHTLVQRHSALPESLHVWPATVGCSLAPLDEAAKAGTTIVDTLLVLKAQNLHGWRLTYLCDLVLLRKSQNAVPCTR